MLFDICLSLEVVVSMTWFSWPIFWGIVLVAMVILEISTLNLVSVWFALAALITLIAALLGVSLPLQFVLFVFCSAVGFLIFTLLIRPKIQKIRTTPTNADRIIGEIGIVVEAICPVEDTGFIRVKGQTWSARTDLDFRIEKDELVRVVSIRGVKAVVIPFSEENSSEEFETNESDV